MSAAGATGSPRYSRRAWVRPGQRHRPARRASRRQVSLGAGLGIEITAAFVVERPLAPAEVDAPEAGAARHRVEADMKIPFLPHGFHERVRLSRMPCSQIG